MADVKTVRRGRGRPALPATEGKRYPLNMRTTKEVRDKLQQAADESGRSLAQEVESRLEHSFASEDANERAFGGSSTHKFFRMLASGVDFIETRTGHSWQENYFTFKAVASALARLLRQVSPRTPKRLMDAAKMVPPGSMPSLPKAPALSREVLDNILISDEVRTATLQDWERYDREMRDYMRDMAAWQAEFAVYRDAQVTANREIKEAQQLGEKSVDGLFPKLKQSRPEKKG